MRLLKSERILAEKTEDLRREFGGRAWRTEVALRVAETKIETMQRRLNRLGSR